MQIELFEGKIDCCSQPHPELTEDHIQGCRHGEAPNEGEEIYKP